MGQKERVDLDRTFQISGSLAKGDGQWRPATFRDRDVFFFGGSKPVDNVFQSDPIPGTITGHWIGCVFYVVGPNPPDADATLSPLKNQVNVSSTYGTLVIPQDTPVDTAFRLDWPIPIDLIPTDEISWSPDGLPVLPCSVSTSYLLRRA